MKPCIWMFMAASLACAAPCTGKPDTIVFALFDLSPSTDQARARYAADFESMLAQLADGGRPSKKTVLFAADAITENSLATSSFPVNDCFAAYSMLRSNPRMYARDTKKISAEVSAKVKALLAGKAPDTDILGALQLPAKAFGANPAAEKYLVIFSDMLEDSRRYRFERENLSETRTRQILQAEKTRGMLPALTGAKVWVDGAGAHSKLGPERLQAIQRFWSAYFAAAGARLTPEHYAAALLNFRLSQ